MGSSYSVICKDCGTKYQINEGRGFFFHKLRCDVCGREREVQFHDLGDLHLRFVKGLPGPYCLASMESDKKIQQEYPGESLTESRYHAEVEVLMEACKCGGNFRFKAPPRCPNCKSTKFDLDPNSGMIMYD